VWHYACRYGGRSLFVNVAPKMKDWTEAIIAAACVTIFVVWCTAIIAMYWE
jgi:hypothetical protein